MMKRSFIFIIIVCCGLFCVVVFSLFNPVILFESHAYQTENEYTGAASCRECHEKFYKLWEQSHHAKAMQPFSKGLANLKLTPQPEDISIGRYHYQIDISTGTLQEKGPDGEKSYPVKYVLGGKNVFYFLTPMERGRLQTLPVAYDVLEKKWFDTAKSGVRHFPGLTSDEPVNWNGWPYTFNTACYNCHVSQSDTNYDLKTGTYKTRWNEPGINCETCHGPCGEHIRVCREAAAGTIPKDLRVIRGGRDLSVGKNNDTCTTCHAKMTLISEGFTPGDSYFDFFDLVTLENTDYYPDGRDLGENYTLTSWLLSPCVKSGELSCLHCHTSSGRYKQKNDPNQSCMPCHQIRVENVTAHTFHKKESKGSQCISCHMPMTSFARIRRSDHSMLPPTPSATIAFDSPNACNLCHTDKDAVWADTRVRKWRKRDYQAPLIQRAKLIDAARKGNWKQLPEMLDYIKSKDHDAVFAASLIRLLRACSDQRVLQTLLSAAKDSSPLVRSSAIDSLGRFPIDNTRDVLLTAAGDEVLLVRIKAAASLAGVQTSGFADKEKNLLDKATEEYLASMKIRPDNWGSHYNLGNYYWKTGDLSSALSAYEQAMKLDPFAVMPMVNAAMIHAQNGENKKAEKLLLMALKNSPENAVANFNMGLLMAEQKEKSESEKYLRQAIKLNPNSHQAVFILGMLQFGDHPDESIKLLSAAFEMNKSHRYAYTLAFYQYQNKLYKQAENTLCFLVENWPVSIDSYLLLADVYTKQNRQTKAVQLLKNALNTKKMDYLKILRLKEKLRSIKVNR